MSVGRSGGSGRGGFTLIEVVAALVIFSMGVLMVLRLSSASGTRMRYAGVSSALAVLATERLDSLDATPLATLVAGTSADTLVVEGIAYERAVTLTALTPILARVDVVLSPVGGAGPVHQVTSYLSEVW